MTTDERLEKIADRLYGAVCGFVERSLLPIADKVKAIEERSAGRIQQLEERVVALESQLAEMETKSGIRRVA